MSRCLLAETSALLISLIAIGRSKIATMLTAAHFWLDDFNVSPGIHYQFRQNLTPRSVTALPINRTTTRFSHDCRQPSSYPSLASFSLVCSYFYHALPYRFIFFCPSSPPLLSSVPFAGFSLLPHHHSITSKRVCNFSLLTIAGQSH